MIKNLVLVILLSKTLETSYEKQIPFQQFFSGTITILSKDLSLIARLLQQFRKLFGKQTKAYLFLLV
jgi:hypothetical protein